jgi:hypothetical protein
LKTLGLYFLFNSSGKGNPKRNVFLGQGKNKLQTKEKEKRKEERIWYLLQEAPQRQTLLLDFLVPKSHRKADECELNEGKKKPNKIEGEVTNKGKRIWVIHSEREVQFDSL